ncbi:hypothetical protein FXO38_26766 [Capsicum annuum]|nr:hypothetical protein FXO38_26766 [Capsicum annuum]
MRCFTCQIEGTTVLIQSTYQIESDSSAYVYPWHGTDTFPTVLQVGPQSVQRGACWLDDYFLQFQLQSQYRTQFNSTELGLSDIFTQFGCSEHASQKEQRKENKKLASTSTHLGRSPGRACSHAEFREYFTPLAYFMEAQNERPTTILANLVANTAAAKIQDFIRMNPPFFTEHKSDEDPQEFLDQVQKVTNIMGLIASESAKFFPLELREVKVLEFINLKKGNMSVNEYSLKFTHLARYAPHVVANSRSKMSKFVSGVSNSMVKECQTTMLIKEMDISMLMVYAQQIEEAKNKEKESENKRAKMGSFNFTQPKDDNKIRAPGPKPQGSVSSARINPLCEKYGRNHQGVCRAGSNMYFGCGKPGHRIKDCPQSGSQDPRASLSFVTPYIVVDFGVSPEILAEPFLVSTQVGWLYVASDKIPGAMITLNLHVNLVQDDRRQYIYPTLESGLNPRGTIILIASSLQVFKHCLSLTMSLMAYHNSDGLSQLQNDCLIFVDSVGAKDSQLIWLFMGLHDPKVVDGIKMELFGATTIITKIILEGGLVAVDDGSGSGSGAAVGTNDDPLTIFETIRHYDYDQTGCIDFSSYMPSYEIQKIAKILPTYLDMSGFLDQKIRTDWSMIGAYRDKLAYAEYLSNGLQIPNNGLDVGLLHKRYAALLWKYGEAKAQKPYANDTKDPQRPKPNSIIPNEEQLVHID